MKIPTINVNLTKCSCGEARVRALHGAIPEAHLPTCSAFPVLIPCPIQRSVTFEVALGECICPMGPPPRKESWMDDIGHALECPARPIKVACSISGTWEASEARDAMRVGAMGREYHIPTDDKIQAAVRERWALVKALVLGARIERDPLPSFSSADSDKAVAALFAQRDAVFSALADMARAEEQVWTAQERACRTMEATFIPDNFMNEEPHSRPSASILERYVERLIEQVGVPP